jgi:hypothetical protein
MILEQTPLDRQPEFRLAQVRFGSRVDGAPAAARKDAEGPAIFVPTGEMASKTTSPDLGVSFNSAVRRPRLLTLATHRVSDRET